MHRFDAFWFHPTHDAIDSANSLPSGYGYEVVMVISMFMNQDILSSITKFYFLSQVCIRFVHSVFLLFSFPQFHFSFFLPLIFIFSFHFVFFIFHSAFSDFGCYSCYFQLSFYFRTTWKNFIVLGSYVIQEYLVGYSLWLIFHKRQTYLFRAIF